MNKAKQNTKHKKEDEQNVFFSPDLLTSQDVIENFLDYMLKLVINHVHTEYNVHLGTIPVGEFLSQTLFKINNCPYLGVGEIIWISVLCLGFKIARHVM